MSVLLHEGTLDSFPLKQVLGDKLLALLLLKKKIHIVNLRWTLGRWTHVLGAAMLPFLEWRTHFTQDFMNNVENVSLPDFSTI